jgi:long-subunit fatty acid transport protein
MYKRIVIIALIEICALGPGALSASESNYQPYILGLRASGMAGAVSADAEGMDACYYNPAGLANSQSGSISASANLYGIQHSKVDDNLYPSEDLTANTLATIPTGISLIFPYNDNLKWAFSVFVPMQISAKEIESFITDNKEHYYNFSNSLQVFLIGPSLGYKANDKLNLGISVYCAYTSSSQFLNLFWKDYNYSFSADYKYSVYAAVVSAGIQYKLTDVFNLGLSATSPSIRIAGKGTLHESAVMSSSETPNPVSVYEDNLEADNGIPAQIKMGISYNVPKKFALGFDATYHFAHSYDWLQEEDACSQPECSNSINIRRSHKAITDFQAGGEYYINKKYPVRAGFFTSFSSAPDPEPGKQNELPQIDLYGFTASFGIEIEHVITTLGAQYVFGNGKTMGYKLIDTNTLEPTVVSTYEDSIYISLSTAYIF